MLPRILKSAMPPTQRTATSFLKMQNLRYISRTTSTALSFTGPVTTTPTSAAANDGASEQSTGLSSGAKAGIGIGAALGALAIIALAAFFIWRSRRAKGYNSGEPMTGAFPNEKDPEGGAGDVAPGTLRAELHDIPVAELGDTDNRMVEAEGDHWRSPMSPQELDSGSHLSPH